MDYIKLMPVQLPNNAVACGYIQTRPYHWEQLFSVAGKSGKAYIGTEKELAKMGIGYHYQQTGPHCRQSFAQATHQDFI